jgi:membrane-associated phospholipid phosphatase
MPAAPGASNAAAPPPVSAASAEACLRWNALTTALAAEAKLPPPLFARAYALVSVACHDGLVAGSRAGHAPLDGACVVGGAAADVLVELFPASATRIEDALAADVAAARQVSPGAAQRGVAFGRLAGRVAVRIARRDGSTNLYDGAIPTGDGYWTGTNPVLPACGTWRTWVATSGAEFQPPPPYAFGSTADLADVAAVVDAAASRTAEQEAIVHEWADRAPPAIWNALLRDEIAARGLTVAQASRVQAAMNVAIHDAFVSCWRAKYTYWTARPFQRIPGLVTVIPTPNFPSYISGHSTISAAAAEVLAATFPDKALFFRAEADEAAISRLWGGIHYPNDNGQGLDVGRRLGAKVVARMQAEGAAL